MIKTKQQIIAELGDSFNSLADICTQVKHEHFNISNDSKWSEGENIQHLVNATKMTNVAFNVPKFVHVLLYGKPGRTSHSCSKVIDNYQKQLEHGAKASGPYIPKKRDYQRELLQQRIKVQKQAQEQAARTSGNAERAAEARARHAQTLQAAQERRDRVEKSRAEAAAQGRVPAAPLPAGSAAR